MRLSTLRNGFKRPFDKLQRSGENVQEDDNIVLLKSLAVGDAVGELNNINKYNFEHLKFLFFKYPELHKKFFEIKFPQFEYLETVEKILEYYNYSYHFSQNDEIKNLLAAIDSVLLMDEKGKIILGMFHPVANIPSAIIFDKIYIIGTALYNFYYQQNKNLLINSDKKQTFQELLQHMETQGINDLHIKSVNEKQSTITARIGMDVVPVTDLPILNSYVEELIHQAKLLMKVETLEEPPEMTGLLKINLVDTRNMPIERTFRMNIIITASGLEKTSSVSIRRFMNLAEIEKLGLHGLGYRQKARNLLKKIKLKEHGVNIVAGATNTGKSTLLACILNELDKEGYRIISVEDPVEMVAKYDKIDLSITSNAEEKFKMTMERALKAVLRHDPDVVLINEVRTKQQIRDYVELGLKGHIAWTTTHAGSAKATILKFLQAIETPLDLIESLNGIVVQELLNKKCKSCQATGLTSSGDKCSICNGSGKKGIVPITEIVYFKHLESNEILSINGEVDFKKFFDFKTLIKEGKIEYVSKVDVARELFEEGIIFEKDWERIKETEDCID